MMSQGEPGGARSRSRRCGRSSSLPAANVPNYTHVAQQMRRGAASCQPASRLLCAALGTGPAQAPGTWSAPALMVQSL